MDSVLNRPLFRRRDARDRLNDVAGVQKFQVGGPVGGMADDRPDMRVIPSVIPTSDRPQGIEEALFATDPYLMETFTAPDLPRRPPSARELKSQQFGATARGGLAGALDRTAGVISAAGSGMYGAAADFLSPAFSILGADTLAAELERMSDIAYNIARTNLANGYMATAGMSAEDFDMEPAEFDFVVAKAEADARKEAEVRSALPDPLGRSGMEMEARGSRPPADPKLGPSGMEMEARGSRPPVPGTTAPDAMGPSGMEMEARGRGPLITDPDAVAAGLNDPNPEVRDKTVADYMKEFTENAPKYEGGDKRLMHAMIGFAIAAGDSPNAMTNIARGLQAGAEMMLKDKAAKDEFDRQIQLSAMQYGLGEVSKERALDRQFSNYVAGAETTYRGKTYAPGESVPVLHSDIINGRMPSGVVSESLSDAMMTTDAALRKAALEAQKEQKLTPEQYRATITELDSAASSFSASRQLIPLIEASIIRNADGEVTGLKAAATKAMNQAANALGIDLGSEFESREAYDSAMRNVSVRMVQDLLGESGKTISDADRQLIDRLVGLQADILSGVLADPNVVNARLQEILRTAESKQQAALDTYTTLMDGFGGMLSPSGTPFRSAKAERVFSPAEAPRAFEYTLTEDGRYIKRYLDGSQ